MVGARRSLERFHETAHPSRGGAAKPRDSLSQPGCRTEPRSMFWDGTRWADERPAPPTPALRPRRRRSPGAGVLVGLLLFAGVAGAASVSPDLSSVSASSPSRLRASWSTQYSLRTVDDANTRLKYRGSWHKVMHPN